jgi:hypothetical protein
MKSPSPIILILAAATGCNLMQSGSDIHDFELNDGPVTGTIQGMVMDVDGEALADIPVTLSDGREALTDAEGRYRFEKVELDSYVVKVSVLDYAEQFRKVLIDDWRTHNANFELYPTGIIFDVDNSQGGLFEEGRLLVDAPPFAFAAPGESPRDGMVQLALTVPDVLETGTAGAPGNFTTLEDDRQLVSFGFWDIRVFQDGEQINVADGSTVTLEYELFTDEEMPRAQAHLMGDTMPLWTFDSDSASWVQMDELPIVEDEEGFRSVSAELPHFSPWNCDDLFAATCVEVWVEDQMGNAIEGVEVSLDGVDYISTVISNTDENGLAVVSGMPNGVANLLASMMVGDKPYNEGIDMMNLSDAIGAGDICPIKTTITMPVCMVGGDISLAVVNSYNIDENGDIEVVRVPQGSAMFYEPTTDFGACADPMGEEMEPGDWMVLEPEEDMEDLYTPEEYENTDAGDIIRLEDEDVAIDMTVEADAEGDLYYVTDTPDIDVRVEGDPTGELLTDNAVLDIKVQGDIDGLPGFEVEDVVELADTPEIQVISRGDDSIIFEPGDELTIEIDHEPGDTDDTFVMVTTVDGTALLGKFAADDDPTLPTWVTDQMPDNSGVTVFKQTVNYVELPTGYYARTTATNASMVVAKTADAQP